MKLPRALQILCLLLAQGCATVEPPAPATAIATVAASPEPVPVPLVVKETPPASGPTPTITFPSVVRTETKAGLELNVVEMNRLPTVDLKLIIRSGSAVDPSGMPGIAQLTADMLKEGTRKRSSSQIAEQVDFLGAQLWVDNDEENTFIQIRALSEHLDQAMELLADLVMRPRFSGSELKKLKKRELDRLALRQKDPNFLVAREFFKRLYGDHPYGKIDTTERVVRKVRTSDLKAFHRKHFAPNNSLLVAVGAVKPEAIQASAERAFVGWRKRRVDKKPMAPAPRRDGRQVVIVDRPESVQSVIFVGNLALDRKSPDFVALEVANQVLGGSAASRLFMDLREKQSLTYGAYSRIYQSIDIAPFRAYAAVRNEVTAQAMTAFMKQLNAIVSEAAPTEELTAAKRYLVDQLPLRIDTARKVASMIADLRIYGLPDDYWQQFRTQVEAISPEVALAAAKRYITLDDALIVVVGKAAAVKDALTKYGPVTVVDTDGNLVADSVAPAPQPHQPQQPPSQPSKEE